MQAGAGEGLELGLHLAQQLAAHARTQEHVHAVPADVPAEHPARVDEVGHLLGRQHGPALDQGHVQTDRQAGQPPRARHRVRGGGRRDHEARGRQHPFAMTPFDGFVDLDGGAEIVRRNDELLQAATSASSRWRRNWKNSTPSRRRRFIISGLVIISPMIEAIFDGRK